MKGETKPDTGGAYHLHGKPGNSSRKIKCYASFHHAENFHPGGLRKL